VKYIRIYVYEYTERIFASNLSHWDRKPKYLSKFWTNHGGDGKRWPLTPFPFLAPEFVYLFISIEKRPKCVCRDAEGAKGNPMCVCIFIYVYIYTRGFFASEVTSLAYIFLGHSQLKKSTVTTDLGLQPSSHRLYLTIHNPLPACCFSPFLSVARRCWSPDFMRNWYDTGTHDPQHANYP